MFTNEAHMHFYAKAAKTAGLIKSWKKHQAELESNVTNYRGEDVSAAVRGKMRTESHYCDNSNGMEQANEVQFNAHEPTRHQFVQFATAKPGSEPQSANPDNTAGVLGFAVLNRTPWHFGGIYAQEDDAKRVARNLGFGYEVHYGLHRFNSDDSFY